MPEREAAFRWLAPLFEENYVFLAPRGRSFDVRRPEQMKDKRITLIRGGAQAAALRELGYATIVEARSIDEVHRFLIHGMADAAFGEREIVRSSLRSRGEIGDFDTSEPVRKTAAWLA
ncbi:transporter substrate-binding domain-containing protein [Massilia sp. H-1]|nr:transporter substrate-binding domain-containing protein [Massilia sp. H-1]